MNSSNTLRNAIRFALLPCVATAAWLPAATLAQSAGTGELEEVVVTARKQVETLQTVPLAITAISASTIADLGLSDLADISKISAGLVLADSDGGKGSPIGLFVVLLLVIAVYFLWRSMNKQMKKIDPELPAGPDDRLQARDRLLTTEAVERGEQADDRPAS